MRKRDEKNQFVSVKQIVITDPLVDVTEEEEEEEERELLETRKKEFGRKMSSCSSGSIE